MTGQRLEAGEVRSFVRSFVRFFSPMLVLSSGGSHCTQADFSGPSENSVPSPLHTGETIIVAPPRGSGGDMALSDLVDCDITLLEGVAALWVDKLVRCRVVSLPIAGAVHITGCEVSFTNKNKNNKIYQKRVFHMHITGCEVSFSFFFFQDWLRV
ncbi:hypothetical protein T492DRAFT_21127 [Pavlovales sp. CCMP2436]|nr:hypothetical protein T492DRAFT_21127 [Pavlovales sp. CCMP2436]